MINSTDIFTHSIYEPAKRIAKHLLEYDNILLSCHMSPDADAIGSMFALAFGLKSLGKTVAMCNDSDLPSNIEWLPKPSRVHKTLTGIGFKPNLAVVLDCGDARRLGKLEKYVLAYPSISIDHHIDNPLFGSIANWVDSQMAATGQMVAAILYELEVPMQGNISEALYAAISADTGGFRYDNTSEQILLLASYLVSLGVNVASIRNKMDNNWSVQRVKLWGELLSNVRMERNNSIAMVTVSSKQLAKHKTKAEDLEGLVEYLRHIQGVLAVGVIREDNPKQSKVSLRSTGEINVQAMLSPLGGGGHRNAAGALVKKDLKDSYDLVLQAMNKWLDGHKS